MWPWTDLRSAVYMANYIIFHVHGLTNHEKKWPAKHGSTVQYAHTGPMYVSPYQTHLSIL